MGFLSRLFGLSEEESSTSSQMSLVVCSSGPDLNPYFYHYNGIEKTEAELKARIAELESSLARPVVIDPNDLYSVFNGNVEQFEAYKTGKQWFSNWNKTEYKAIKERLAEKEATRIIQQRQNVAVYHQPQHNHQPVNRPQAVYVKMHETYKDILVQQVSWEQEKQKQELALQRDKEQWAYDLQVKRIVMEQELKEYELKLSDHSLTRQQQLEIERLKLEIENLKMQLEYRQ